MMDTGIKTGQVLKTKNYEFYAADAGIEHGLVQVNNYDMTAAFPTYSQFDYTSNWSYSLPENINGDAVNVSINNLWIPSNIAMPVQSYAQNLTQTGKLMITGGVVASSTYEMRIVYYKGASDLPLQINTLGVWLPAGFTYNTTGNCTLGQNSSKSYYALPVTGAHYGGQKVIWTFASGPLFAGNTSPPAKDPFPGVNATADPMVSTIRFNYVAAKPGANPDALAWVTTSGVNDIPYAWDSNINVYKLTSTAGDTEIQASSIRNKARRLSGAFNGDYAAIGGSLITGEGSSPWYMHFQLQGRSTAAITTGNDSVTAIPSDATVQAAFLYWTGWIDWNTYSSAASQTRYPSGDLSRLGTWDKTANMYSYVDENGANDGDTTYLLHGTANGSVLFTFPSFNLSSGSSIQRLTVTLYAKEGTSGTNRMQPAIRAGNTNYFTTSTSTEVPSSYSSISYNYNTNPKTGLAWTVDDINGVGANALQAFGVYSADANPAIRLTQVYATVTYNTSSLEYPANATAANIQNLVENNARVNRALFNGVSVNADSYQVMEPNDNVNGVINSEKTWVYTAMKDVTDLVLDWITAGNLSDNGAGNYTFGHYFTGTDPGADNYRVNAEVPTYTYAFTDISGNTGYPLGTPAPASGPAPRYNLAHAGWSLVVVYTSPGSLGHQLYMYDISNPNFHFFSGYDDDFDFDNDGLPGGIVSGFLVPNQIPGETLAGRVSVMVGEGDLNWLGDALKLNGISMNNSISSATNVWDGRSPNLGAVAGMDLDTFDVTWSSNILRARDVSVNVSIPTLGAPTPDFYTMSYMILSFRSALTSGGSIAYQVRQREH